MRRLAQRRNPIQMTEFQELVQQSHATATEWQPSTVNPRRPKRSGLAVCRLKVIDAVPERTHLSSLRTPLALLAVSLSFIAGVWWWIAQPINLSRPPIDASTRLDCVSYAPFRGQQNPLNPALRVPAQQIAEDLAQLSRITDCVRTYSVDNGLDQVPALAAKAGLKVIHGIWLSNDRLKNRQQIDASVALAKEYPGVITAIVVGNEVLLRGEMTATDLAGYIRSVKAQVTGIPVTYADVWEYWLRHREIYEAVDFITIHILPYWEDFPIRARYAAAHVDSIRKRVAVAFPAKEILIGETGWPSAGRMREGALPSRTNQARVVSEVLELARREKYRVNLIEAYDQPWKRQLEGTVGGYWGLFDADQRALKYPPGQAINNYPAWKWQMGAGLAYCTLVFLVALADPATKAMAAALDGLGRDRTLGDRGWRAAGHCRRQAGAGELGSGRLAALGHAVRRGRPDAGVRRRCLDRRPAAADLRRIDRTGAHARSRAAVGAARALPCGHRGDRPRNRARLRVRRALSRFSVRGPDHGRAADRRFWRC